MSKSLPKRSEDYSLWYNELVKRAGLAENSSVRGCMVIKPYGYAIWEKMQRTLDDMFKRTGHQNAYFPLFVPKSLFEAEEKNAEGFAKECAVVTHYRLQGLAVLHQALNTVGFNGTGKPLVLGLYTLYHG